MVKMWENVCGRGWYVRFFVCFCSCEAWRRDIRMNMSGRGARGGGGLLMQKEQKGQSEDRSVVRKTRGGRGGGIKVWHGKIWVRQQGSPMLVDVLGKYIYDVLMLLPPLEDGSIEMVFVEMAREDIDGLVLLQVRWHDAIQVQPIVEYQD